MEKKPEETLSDIRQMMERSSRFRSLSGFSFIASGIIGILGVGWIHELMDHRGLPVSVEGTFSQSSINRLILAAVCTLIAAAVTGFFLTLLKIRKRKLLLADVAFRRVTASFAVPMITGGIFIIGMLVYHQYLFIASVCLLFYGLALFNAGHYSMKEISYLGIIEIMIGIICLFAGYGLLFLAIGFGLMNILLGLILWKKYPE